MVFFVCASTGMQVLYQPLKMGKNMVVVSKAIDNSAIMQYIVSRSLLIKAITSAECYKMVVKR